MKLQDLKTKSPAALLELAEELKIENASAMRKQDMMFAILKSLAEQEVEIFGQALKKAQDYFSKRRGNGAR